MITSAAEKNEEVIDNEFEIESFNNQKTTIRPKGAGVGIENILDWQPSDDASEQIYRGTVPLAGREKGYKINTLASEETKLLYLAYMGSNAAHTSAFGCSEKMS